MTSNGISDISLDQHDIKLLRRYEGGRYVILLLIPLLCLIAGTADLLVAARISAQLGGDLAGLVSKWLDKASLYAGTWSGGLLLAFDKLEAAIMFYGLAVLFGLLCLAANRDRKLFRKVILLSEKSR